MEAPNTKAEYSDRDLQIKTDLEARGFSPGSRHNQLNPSMALKYYFDTVGRPSDRKPVTYAFDSSGREFMIMGHINSMPHYLEQHK